MSEDPKKETKLGSIIESYVAGFYKRQKLVGEWEEI